MASNTVLFKAEIERISGNRISYIYFEKYDRSSGNNVFHVVYDNGLTEFWSCELFRIQHGAWQVCCNRLKAI